VAGGCYCAGCSERITDGNSGFAFRQRLRLISSRFGRAENLEVLVESGVFVADDPREEPQTCTAMRSGAKTRDLQGVEETLHLRAGMLIALANSRLNALGEDCFSVFAALVLCQGLRIHLIAGNVVGIGLNERPEV